MVMIMLDFVMVVPAWKLQGTASESSWCTVDATSMITALSSTWKLGGKQTFSLCKHTQHANHDFVHILEQIDELQPVLAGISSPSLHIGDTLSPCFHHLPWSESNPTPSWMFQG